MTLSPAGYRQRLVDGRIKSMLDIFGAVCVEGPKWCGKTWTSLNASESVFSVGDPSGNFQNRRLAEIDVYAAFEGKEPHLIDEWQEVPSIWDAARYEVDRSDRKGRFILTGSSTPVFKGIMHSGAGRIGAVRMRTMSLFESGDSEGKVSLGALFDGTQGTALPDREVPLKRLIYLTVRGGWPSTVSMDEGAATKVLKSYLEKAVDDASVFEGRTRDRSKVAMLVRSLARNESTYVSAARIARDISDTEDGSISTATVAEYGDILSRMFLTEDQPSFNMNFRSSARVGKSPKRHLTDPALAVAALGMSGESLYRDLETYGFMFEAMCERDLDVYASAYGGRLMQYRDSGGLEADAVVEMPDGRWGAFEIKLGTNQIDSAAENLLKLAARAPEGREPALLCVICGTSSYAYRREDGVYVVPPTLLRN